MNYIWPSLILLFGNASSLKLEKVRSVHDLLVVVCFQAHKMHRRASCDVIYCTNQSSVIIIIIVVMAHGGYLACAAQRLEKENVWSGTRLFLIVVTYRGHLACAVLEMAKARPKTGIIIHKLLRI